MRWLGAHYRTLHDLSLFSSSFRHGLETVLFARYQCIYTSAIGVLHDVVLLVFVGQETMQDYFNNQMRLAGMAAPDGDPIISCQVNLDKNFAFLEVCQCSLLQLFNMYNCEFFCYNTDLYIASDMNDNMS